MNKQAIIDSNVLVALTDSRDNQDFDMIAWLKRICQATEVKKVFAEDDQRNPHNP